MKSYHCRWRCGLAREKKFSLSFPLLLLPLPHPPLLRLLLLLLLLALQSLRWRRQQQRTTNRGEDTALLVTTCPLVCWVSAAWRRHWDGNACHIDLRDRTIMWQQFWLSIVLVAVILTCCQDHLVIVCRWLFLLEFASQAGHPFLDFLLGVNWVVGGFVKIWRPLSFSDDNVQDLQLLLPCRLLSLCVGLSHQSN